MEKFSLSFQQIATIVFGLYAVVLIHNTFSDVWPQYSSKYYLFESNHPNNTAYLDRENVGEIGSVESFPVNVNKNILNDLRVKLESELERIKGVDSPLRNVTLHWLKQYNWKGNGEKLINKHPQFRTEINGRFVHFQHIRPKLPRASMAIKTRPLLLLHGRHSSLMEFQNIIPFLLQPENSRINFELIIPSLPGFGESQHSTGLVDVETPKLLLQLMESIGHGMFYIHGAKGWGSEIAANMAALYPHNVVGLHLSTCESTHPLSFLKDLARSFIPAILTLDIQEINRLQEIYFQNSNTEEINRPNVALCDSPTVMAAHFLKKNGIPLEDSTVDSFLDNIMIHWLACPTTKSENVMEIQNNQSQSIPSMERVPIFVPTSCTAFEPKENEVEPQPRYVIGDKFRQIIHFTNMKHKSLFPAAEIPEILANDILSAFNLLEKRGFAFFEGYHECQLYPYI